MPNTIRILAVHGVGDHHSDLGWEQRWRAPIEQGVQAWNPGAVVEVRFVAYDDIFAAHPISLGDTTEALARLTASGVTHGVGDALGRIGEGIGSLFRRKRGFLGGLSERVRWSAGMIVQWTENSRLRREARRRLVKAAEDFEPQVVCAHSLGSLITYDAFARRNAPDVIASSSVVTFGSQIGNPFVRSTLGGRIVPLPARRWYHLFNANDDVFTARIRLDDPSFVPLETHFDIDGFADHDAVSYLGHAETRNRVWFDVAAPRTRTRGLRSASRQVQRVAKKSRRKKALLVGINDYPNAGDRLDGCVNDVFLMSSFLQEVGFPAEDIRVVLDDRATARGILGRLDWLLEDAGKGDERVFFYSGHGAQIPSRGFGERVDGVDECLVPYDFDWERENSVTDDQFHELYSQLDYGTHFTTIFDCCHSGGMHRDGGPRVRGLTPPDDVRHRAMIWNVKREMWQDRPLDRANRDMRKRAEYSGVNGSTRRIGRAVELRHLRDRDFNRERRERGHHGPFLPVIYQACGEAQLAEEYRHGVQSYGAFTYSFVKTLRKLRRERAEVTHRNLRTKVGRELRTLGFEQRPELVGPAPLVRGSIRWIPKARGARGARSRKA